MGIAWDQARFVTTGGTSITDAVVANNFQVGAGKIIKKLTVFLSDNTVNDNGLFDSFSGAIGWAIYSDDGGKPGTLLFSGNDNAPGITDTGSQSDAGGDVFKVDLALGEIGLGTGNYWIAIHEGGWGAADDGSPVHWMWNPAGVGWGLVRGGPVGGPAIWSPELRDSAFSIEGISKWDQSDPTTASGVDISQARGAGASFSLAAKTFMEGATVYLTDGVINDNGQLDSFSGNLTWSIVANVGGKPSTAVWGSKKAASIVMTDTGLQSASGADIIRVDFKFDRVMQLNAGDYFLVLHEGNDAAAPFDGSSVYWAFNASGTGPETHVSSIVGGNVVWTGTGGDTSFQLWEAPIELVNSHYGDVFEDMAVSMNIQQFLWTSTDDFTITITSSANRGTAVVDNNGTPDDPTDDFIRYTPNTNALGSDQFKYTVTSGAYSKTATVSLNLVPTNDAPVVSNFAGDAVTWYPVSGFVRLDTGTRAAVTDIDSSEFTGGVLTISIAGGGAPGEDRIYFPNSDRIQQVGNDLYVVGNKIGTMSTAANGTVTLTMTGNATLSLMTEALRSVAYANTSATPTAGTRTITYTLTDGDGTLNGGTDTASWTSTVNVVALDTSGIANADARELNEGQKVNIFVTANDSDANGPLVVTTINGMAISSGGSITLPSGAVVWLLANGKLQYDAAGAFDYLVSAATGAARGAVSSAMDRFIYSLADGSTAMVSVTVNGLDNSDGRLAGSAGNDVMTGTSGSDTFLLAAGGNDRVSGGDGADYFYFGGALRPGDVVNGGAGTDTVILRGDYLSDGVSNKPLVLDGTMLNSIEMLVLAAGSNTSFGGEAGNFTYRLKLADSLVPAGQMFTVQGSKLGAQESLYFDGSAETNGTLRLVGGAGADSLTGGAGADWLWGGGGGDSLRGNGGADTFYFSGVAGVTGWDQINDLQRIDKIDLSAMDANINTPEDDAFIFIGTAAFSGVAGQLRYTQLGEYWGPFGPEWLVEMDRDGDGRADYYLDIYGEDLHRLEDATFIW